MDQTRGSDARRRRLVVALGATVLSVGLPAQCAYGLTRFFPRGDAVHHVPAVHEVLPETLLVIPYPS